jgi:hypothetical protein
MRTSTLSPHPNERTCHHGKEFPTIAIRARACPWSLDEVSTGRRTRSHDLHVEPRH